MPCVLVSLPLFLSLQSGLQTDTQVIFWDLDHVTSFLCCTVSIIPEHQQNKTEWLKWIQGQCALPVCMPHLSSQSLIVFLCSACRSAFVPEHIPRPRRFYYCDVWELWHLCQNSLPVTVHQSPDDLGSPVDFLYGPASRLEWKSPGGYVISFHTPVLRQQLASQLTLRTR